jgi:hypothetical protein
MLGAPKAQHHESLGEAPGNGHYQDLEKARVNNRAETRLERVAFFGCVLGLCPRCLSDFAATRLKN